MIECLQVIATLEETLCSGGKAALATVTKVKGSAYRGEGAKMMIDGEGRTVGMISGGCLEADVAQLAEEVIEQGIPMYKQYALDEDVVWGLGLGCPGKVDLYLEPVTPEDMEISGPFGAWLLSMKKQRAGVLGTILDAEVGQGRMFIPEQGNGVGSLGTYELDECLISIAQEKLGEQDPKSETRLFNLPGGETIRVFIDVYVPPTELIIFGAGHDAIPLANASRALGWKTTVVDPRPAYNNAERFPGANRILVHPHAFSKNVTIGKRTYAVVMNHHIERDQETLKFILPSEAPYVGILGPRSRRIRMLEAIEKEGVVIPASCMERMYSPIGLDIGAVSPEEIAVSIVAEILSIRNGHSGGFLQGKEAIHRHPVRDNDILTDLDRPEDANKFTFNSEK